MDVLKPIAFFSEALTKNISLIWGTIVLIIGLLACDHKLDFAIIPDIIIGAALLGLIISLIYQFILFGLEIELVVFVITTWLSAGLLSVIIFNCAYNSVQSTLNSPVIIGTVIGGIVLSYILQKLIPKMN